MTRMVMKFPNRCMTCRNPIPVGVVAFGEKDTAGRWRFKCEKCMADSMDADMKVEVSAAVLGGGDVAYDPDGIKALFGAVGLGALADSEARKTKPPRSEPETRRMSGLEAIKMNAPWRMS